MNVNVYFHVFLGESVLSVSPKELVPLMMTMGGEQPLMETANISVLISPLRHLKPISEIDKNLVIH